MNKYIVLFLISAFSFSTGFRYGKDPVKPLNVIILIGDGMGLSQLSSAYFFSEEEPDFSRFPIVGLSRTSSSREKITDSAAGATAISAGVKTYNGAIGVNEDSSAVETLLEYFEKKGYRSGLIATSSITHATPASFYAHVDSRKKEYLIAEQLLNSGVDFFAAGGRKFFYKEGKSLIADKTTEFTIDTTSLYKESQLHIGKRYGFLLAGDGMPPVKEGRGDFSERATALALEFLSREDTPFFLMIEGSQIDWGGHANDAEYLIEEVLDFNKTVGAVMDFAERNGNTLVIVTADHETGGFTLSAGKKKVPFMGEQSDYNSIQSTFSTEGHSAAMVPVLAYGPGSDRFSGIYQNTEIHKKILKLTGQN